MNDLRSTQQYLRSLRHNLRTRKHRGYHRLIDDLELNWYVDTAPALDVLEQAVAQVFCWPKPRAWPARRLDSICLHMLGLAQHRGLHVVQAR